MGKGRFDYFVILAGMRTGSNLLEEYLSAMPGLTSYGEAFNPHFFGKPNCDTMFGVSLDERDKDPLKVIDRMRGDAAGLPGFRLFHDHDPRVIDHVLVDPRAAKVVLTRRPIDSYVSLKIARKTGKWWSSDMARSGTAKVAFDAEEYGTFLNDLAAFDARIRHALQTTGQTAFRIGYDDLSDMAVIEGLGRFLGAEAPPDPSKVRARVQNPTPVADRLTNSDEAERALLGLSVPDLGHIPSHEPDRGPGLRMFHACTSAPLLYMPIRGAGRDAVPDWLAALDPDGEVQTGMTQKEVRRWMRQHPGHRAFTVLRHPLPRAHDAFCRYILPSDAEAFADIRDALATRYAVPLPAGGPGESWTLDDQRAAFLGFLRFLAGNLGGQTSVRVDNSWASQAVLLEAIARFKVPDRVIREDALAEELPGIAKAVGRTEPPAWREPVAEDGFELSSVRTDEIDAACETAYRRDYVYFGFGRWQPVQAA